MTPAGAEPPTWVGAALPFFFVGAWFGMFHLFSTIGGWRDLGRSYRATQPPVGESFRFRSGSFGWVGYGSCLRFVSSPSGLFVAPSLFVRPGHVPLFIPWDDIRADVHRPLLFRYLDLRFPRHPGVRLRVSHGLGQQLLHAGGVRMPEG